MLVLKKNINLIIPQQEPFVMIDNLISQKNLNAVTNILIREDNYFIENHCFNENGMIENMAQSAAAYLGYETYIKQLPVKEGFIAQVKNFEVFALPKINETIETTIDYISVVMNIHIVKATIRLNKEIIAESELRIFVNE